MHNLEFAALHNQLVVEDSDLAEVVVHNLAVMVVVRIPVDEFAARSPAEAPAVRNPAEVADRRVAVRNLVAADTLYADHALAAAAAHNFAVRTRAETVEAGRNSPDRNLEPHIDLAEVCRTAAHPKDGKIARLSYRKMSQSHLPAV